MIAIYVDGGLVQDVIISGDGPYPVVICDADVEGSDDPVADTPWCKCNVRKLVESGNLMSDSEKAQLENALEVCSA